jgi:hypothetical protein
VLWEGITGFFLIATLLSVSSMRLVAALSALLLGASASGTRHLLFSENVQTTALVDEGQVWDVASPVTEAERGMWAGQPVGDPASATTAADAEQANEPGAAEPAGTVTTSDAIPASAREGVQVPLEPEQPAEDFEKQCRRRLEEAGITREYRFKPAPTGDDELTVTWVYSNPYCFKMRGTQCVPLFEVRRQCEGQGQCSRVRFSV